MGVRTRAEVVARIRACLRYADPAQNSNEHERDTARKTAERMMAEHGVTRSEVEGEEVAKAETEGMVDIWNIRIRVTPEDEAGDVGSAFAAHGIRPSPRGWGSSSRAICSECSGYGTEMFASEETGEPLCGMCLANERG